MSENGPVKGKGGQEKKRSELRNNETGEDMYRMMAKEEEEGKREQRNQK